MEIYKKLAEIQKELKAPKNQYNSFGKYNYRSCEDILEGVKPLAAEKGCAVVISDDVVMVGDRYYIKATAKLIDADSGEVASNDAYAREPAEKKGMDESQITGTASSYARKYALNGLFAIDDTKDADTDEHANQSAKNSKQKDKQQNKPTDKQQTQSGKAATEAQLKRLWAVAGKVGVDESGLHEFIQKAFKKQSIKELTGAEVDAICKRLENR